MKPQNIQGYAAIFFNYVEAIQRGQKYHDPELWQQYEEFGIHIFDFADALMLSLYFGIKKFMISSITVETRIKIEKQVLRFAESMLLTGAIPTDS